MAVPAELMAALQGGGAQGMAPAPEEMGESQGGGLYGAGGGDNVEALRQALDFLQEYAQQEDDDQNIQVVLKCVTALQAILADEQKMQDSMMSGKMDPRSLRRASAGAGAGGPQY